MPTFQRHEAVGEGVRRIARSEIRQAVAALSNPALPPETVLHEVRQTGKRLRALLRLVRPHFAGYRPLDRAVADTVGLLAPQRDADVMLDTYASVAKEAEGAFDDGVRTSLIEHRDAIAKGYEHEAVLVSVAKALVEIDAALPAWRFDARGYTLIGDGLLRTYRSARRGGETAVRSPVAVHLHDWRKQVKYLKHELELLQRASPDMLKGMLANAADLSDILGRHHDLEVLRTEIGNVTGDGRDALRKVIRERQAKLARRAFRLDDELTAEKPRAFSARIATYWRDWRR